MLDGPQAIVKIFWWRGLGKKIFLRIFGVNNAGRQNVQNPNRCLWEGIFIPKPSTSDCKGSENSHNSKHFLGKF